MSIFLPHPYAVTDWQAVAMFLAGFVIEDKPEYAPLIFQVIEDSTRITTALPASPTNNTPTTTQEATL